MSVQNGLFIDKHGNRIWYKDGRKHCIGGPAIEWRSGKRSYYKYGRLHRVDGPAIEWRSGCKIWCLYDSEYTSVEYKKIVSNLPLLYWKRYKMGLWI